MLSQKDSNLIRSLPIISNKNKWVSVTCFLKKFGYKRLDDGAYGVVYEKRGSQNVIKVVATNQNECYLRYARYSFNHSDENRFLPKIYAIIPLESFHVIIMEKLFRKKDQSAKKFAKHFRRHYLDSDDIGDDVYISNRTNIKRKKSLLRIQSFCNRVQNKWFRDYHEKPDNYGVFWDIWPQNIMYRKVGKRYQTVITDPIAG